MHAEDSRRALLEQLRANWDAAWSAFGPGTTQGQNAASAGALLRQQVAALEAGAAASFPFFVERGDEVTWFTVAPSSDDLRLAIDDLRAWLIPSYAAESRVESCVNTGGGGLRPLIAAVSPSGYFVWKTKRDKVVAVARRLGVMRDLTSRRPTSSLSLVSTIYELRQRFRAALVVGDRAAAEGAIDTIARDSLDSASNVAFMRVRLADHFGEHAYVAEWDAVRDLVRLRLPATVRLGLVRAFHAHYLRSAELAGDLGAAERAYRESVEPLLGPVLDLCRAVDGPEVSRCLAYRSRLGAVTQQRLEELRASRDEIVARVLANLTTAHPAEAPREDGFSPLRALEIASRRGDVRSVQEFGELILATRWDELPDPEKARIVSAITDSLCEKANGKLSALLKARAGEGARRPPADTWEDFFSACADREWDRAAPFLERDDRPDATSGGATSLRAFIERIESLLTEPDPTSAPFARTLAIGALIAIIEDCRHDLRFPRSDLGDVYFTLAELLTSARAGSIQHEDASLFLLLSDAVLQIAPDRGRRTASLAESWWLVRPSEALLPFVLDVLSLLSFHGLGRAEAVALWIRAADFVRTQLVELSPGEVAAWSSVGLRLGLDSQAIQGYIGPLDTSGRPDPLTVCGLRRVAIVSLRQKQAQEAARQIRSRCGADVVIVDETDAGPQVRAARNADVILVVWSATTHAVFRGLDQVREKLAYVQGTGAESIVLTLERTAVRGLSPMTSTAAPRDDVQRHA